MQQLQLHAPNQNRNYRLTKSLASCESTHLLCKERKKLQNEQLRTSLFIYLFHTKKRKSFNEKKKKFNEPPNPFGCVLVLLSYHKFRNSTIPFAPFELRTFFFIFFTRKKKCEEKLKFIDRVKVEKEKKSKSVIKV